MNATSTALPSVQPASGKSVAALVLGLLGLVAFQFLSPVAWYLGWSELRDIRAGIASQAGSDYATIGMVLGIIGSALLGLALLAFMAICAIVMVALGVAAAAAAH